MTLNVVDTANAPKAIGPYSQAIQCGSLLFCSGQLPVVPSTGNFCEGGVEAQTEQCLRNMEAILKAAGSSLARVVKTTVFLKDMNDFTRMNGVYERMFAGHRPARSTIEVARLPKDAQVEIECVASVG
jgi:2-iminobutanoate/2-iminopropanoate deaminase